MGKEARIPYMITDILHPGCDLIKIFIEFRLSKHRHQNVFHYDELARYLNQDPNPCNAYSSDLIHDALDIINIWAKLGMVYIVHDFKFGHLTHRDFTHSPLPVWSFRTKWRKYLKKKGLLTS